MAASSSYSRDTILILGSAIAGAALALSAKKLFIGRKSPETDHSIAHDLVWKSSISGALNAAMMYVGDRMNLYVALKEECKIPGSSVTAIDLAKKTGLNQRWLREWLAQQAAMGVLTLLPGEGDDDASLHYRLPAATAEVLADETSKEYDISMIQVIPSMVNRAKTMLPEAMKTGIGRPYDDVEISEGIDRHHNRHIRDIFLPNVLPKALDGKVIEMLEKGCKVVDLGCGAGTMSISLAKRFRNSTFHGFEISKVALEKAAFNVASARLKNVFLHDANEDGESLSNYKEAFDLAVVFDVLHDAVDPMDLIRQVKGSLKPEGVWLLADVPSAPTVRDNLSKTIMPGASFGFSLCLCLSCALSEEGGAGLGTLGLSVPVAKKMLKEAGFRQVDVLSEVDIARWFLLFPLLTMIHFLPERFFLQWKDKLRPAVVVTSGNNGIRITTESSLLPKHMGISSYRAGTLNTQAGYVVATSIKEGTLATLPKKATWSSPFSLQDPIKNHEKERTVNLYLVYIPEDAADVAF